MKKRTLLLSLLFITLFIFITILTILINQNKKPNNTIQIQLGEHLFNLEIAQTFEEKSKGLMFRESLPENQGMIFIYNDEKERSFWMKNTLIPLDIIFLNSKETIVEKKENIPPCKTEDCKTYQSKPAKYVIEINSGLTEKLGLNVGDKIEIKTRLREKV